MPKWGDPTRKWGALDYTYGVDGTNPGGELQWIFLVDWDNNDSFNYNEAQYLIDLETSRGERYFVKPGGNGFEVMRPGEGTATLTDKDGRFDPDNASGPLYEKILPGRKFRLMVKDLATGTTYAVMAGFIYDIPPITELDKIQLSLRESMSLLDRKVNIPILYRNSISDAITALVENAKWPSCFGTAIDSETQQVTTFSVDNINALDTALDLGSASLGQVFSDNTGRLKFYNRGHATMPSIALDQAQLLKQIRRSQPWENQRNIIQVIANKKVKAREAAIWQSGQPIKIDASSSTTIAVNYAPAIDVRVYQLIANTLVTGKGTNATAYVSYTLEAYSKSLSITIANTYGAAVYVTLIITGRPIIDQAIMASQTNALTTQTVFELDNPWMQDLSHAQAYATMISNFLDETQRTIEVQIEQRPALQFAFDLMDAVPLTIAKLAINTTYYVGLIEHRWQADNGQAVTTTLVLRPRLTDGATVANDSEDPDLPYIPEPSLPPGNWPINVPTQPPDSPPVDPENPGGCLTDMDAPANGPFNLVLYPGSLQSNANNVDYPVFGGAIVARPANFTNPTLFAITGDWLKWDAASGAWQKDTSDLWWNVYLNEVRMAIMPHSDSGRGTRFMRLQYGGAERIRTIKVELDGSPAPDPTEWDWSTGEQDWVFGQLKPGTGLGVTLGTGVWSSSGLTIDCSGGWRSGSWSYTVTGDDYIVGAGATFTPTAIIPMPNSFPGAYIDWENGLLTGSLGVSFNTTNSLASIEGYKIKRIWLQTITYDAQFKITGAVLTGVNTNVSTAIYKLVVRGYALYNVCPA